MTAIGDYITVTDDCIIMKITQFSDFVKKGSKLKHAKETNGTTFVHINKCKNTLQIEMNR